MHFLFFLKQQCPKIWNHFKFKLVWYGNFNDHFPIPPKIYQDLKSSGSSPEKPLFPGRFRLKVSQCRYSLFPILQPSFLQKSPGSFPHSFQQNEMESCEFPALSVSSTPLAAPLRLSLIHIWDYFKQYGTGSRSYC